MLFNQNDCQQESVCAWILSNLLPQFLFTVFRKHGERTLKAFLLFRTFVKLSYDKARYF